MKGPGKSRRDSGKGIPQRGIVCDRRDGVGGGPSQISVGTGSAYGAGTPLPSSVLSNSMIVIVFLGSFGFLLLITRLIDGRVAVARVLGAGGYQKGLRVLLPRVGVKLGSWWHGVRTLAVVLILDQLQLGGRQKI